MDPDAFMKSAIVLIIKNKAGDSINIDNYRPIALVIAIWTLYYQHIEKAVWY